MSWVQVLLPLPCLTVKIDPTEKKREKRRFREISPFFFVPNFFRISIDPFSIFLRVEGFELPKTHFFQNFITNESNTKDLNPRQGLGLFRFFVLVTKCLQIVYYKTSPSLLQEDLNQRNHLKFFWNHGIINAEILANASLRASSCARCTCLRPWITLQKRPCDQVFLLVI